MPFGHPQVGDPAAVLDRVLAHLPVLGPVGACAHWSYSQHWGTVEKTCESQALLDSLVESLPSVRVLLLVNYRPEYQHGWGNKTYYTQLRLDPLPPATELKNDHPSGWSLLFVHSYASAKPRRRCLTFRHWFAPSHGALC